MRVCHIVTRRDAGGPALVLAALVPRLGGAGMDQVEIHGTEGPGEGRLPLGDAATFHLPSLQRAVRPLADVSAAWELRRLLHRIRPDVVHTRMARAGALGRPAARIACVAPRARVEVSVCRGDLLDAVPEHVLHRWEVFE